MAEAARKAGSWLACRPGCTQCCLGPFPINQLDARRLRRGLAELEALDPERAGRVRERATRAAERMSAHFPGDARSGFLSGVEADEGRFFGSFEQEPCPALSPDTGTCDLYPARPITCRAFGPAVRYGAGAVSICELCFTGAGDREIAACQVDIDPDGREASLLEELERTDGVRGQTIIAFCLKD